MTEPTEQTQNHTLDALDSIPSFESEWMQYKQHVDDGGNFSLSLFTGEPTTDTGEDMWDISLTKDLVDLHDGRNRRDSERHPLPDTQTPPDAIFITASRGIPFGFAIKSFWQNAYPNEQVPQIKAIDASRRRFNHGASDEVVNRVNQEEIAMLKTLKEKTGIDNVAVFDEIVNGGHTIKNAAALLAEAGYNDVACIFGSVGEIFPGILADEELPLYRQAASYDLSEGHEDVRKLVWNAGEKSRALIRDMKKIGHLMAIEAKRRGVVPPPLN